MSIPVNLFSTKSTFLNPTLANTTAVLQVGRYEHGRAVLTDHWHRNRPYDLRLFRLRGIEDYE